MEECFTLENDNDFINCTNVKHDAYINILERARFTIDLQLLCDGTDNRIFNDFDDYRKGFVRIELPDDKYETQMNALNSIEKLVVIFNLKDKSCVRICMALNMCLIKQIGKQIEVIDTELFLQQHTEEEIYNLIRKEENGKIIYNSKYVFANKKTYYLDIPLFDEFYYDLDKFSGNKNITMVCCEHGNIKEKFEIIVKFEENIVNTMKGTMALQELIPFNTTTFIDGEIDTNSWDVPIDMNRCKYVYVILYRNEDDICSLQNAKVTQVNYNTRTKHTIETENMNIFNLNNAIVYAISIKKDTDMNLFSLETHKSHYFTDNSELHKLTINFNDIVNPIKVKLIHVFDAFTIT